MLSNRFKALTTAAVLVLLVGAFLNSDPADAQVSTNEHVYYGYIPPSTDIAQWLTIDISITETRPTPGEVDEVIDGTKINYTVPSGLAILDVVGLEDGTSIEIWDIYANQKIESTTLDRLEKKFFSIAVGTFFKIVASHRIAALLNGGGNLFTPGSDRGGTSTFYPSVTGGFRGREFIFNGAPATHPYAYSVDRVGYNFYLMALEETDWTLADSPGIWSTSAHLAQRGKRTTIIQSRIHHLGEHNGAGNDVVFHLTTSGDVEVSCCALGDFVAVPAITGGYVGKLFYAPVAVTYEQEGRTAVFIVLPLEEGQVKMYDREMNVIATHSFSASDVQDMNYWYNDLGIGRFDLIAESTGDMAFMVGQTEETAEIYYLGDDITFIGSRPDQEIRFYAPTMAVIFAPETLTVNIDGGAPIQMAKDDFRLLDSGVHSVSADKHVIVEVLAAGGIPLEDTAQWDDWGSYLIEPADMDVSFEAPEGFLVEAADNTMYIVVAAAAAAVVVVVIVFLMMRRRRASRT